MVLERYCSRSVLFKRWDLLEVMRCLKPCSTILFIRKNKFNPFDSAPSATLHFEISWPQKRTSVCRIFCRISNAICSTDDRTSRSLFSAKKFCKLILFWCHEILKRMIANVTESNGLNLFSWVMGIVKESLGHLFIISSRSYFFNQTDFKQYLFHYG